MQLVSASKILITFLLLAVSNLAAGVEILAAKNYASKKCFFSMAQLVPSESEIFVHPNSMVIRNVVYSGQKVGSISENGTFLCVSEVTTNQNTINETKNCTIGYLNPKMDSFKPMTQESDSSGISGGCNKEKVQKLLSASKQLENYIMTTEFAIFALSLQQNRAGLGVTTHFNNFFEMYLLSSSIVASRLIILQDEYNLAPELMLDKNDGTNISIRSQLSHIKVPPNYTNSFLENLKISKVNEEKEKVKEQTRILRDKKEEKILEIKKTKATKLWN